ncbi:hypothetical protein I7412_06910, partial [Frankia sp. CN6]|nr:hypothetical protein [Frankia nepalensis]
MSDTATGGAVGEPGGLPISPSALSARPYVRSATARTGAPTPPAPDQPAGPPGPGEGALRASFADLASASPSGPAAGELAVYSGGPGLVAYDPAAAAKGEPPLLLRSVVDLREVWLPLLAAATVRSISLLGTERGATTALLVELLRSSGGGRLLVADPEPGRVPPAGRGLDIQVVRDRGAAALDGHTPTDAYLVDADANYATVLGTLGAIDDAVQEFGRTTFPLVVVHDVGWPTGRRDQYTAPDRLTDADLQPHSWDAGVTLASPDAVVGRGLRGDGAFAWALAEGGPRNGVRTAVEEFVAGHPELRFFTVAPVFGLGIVVDRRAPYAARIAELLAPWVANPLLVRLERNRLDLYLRVVALRDEALALARLHHAELERLEVERLRLVAADMEKTDRIAELERALAAERAATADALNARLEEPRLVAAARSADSKLRARLRRGPSRLEQARARFAEEERRRREAGETDATGGPLALPPGETASPGRGGAARALPAGSGTAAGPGTTAAAPEEAVGLDGAGPGLSRPGGHGGGADLLADGRGEPTPGLWTPDSRGPWPPPPSSAAWAPPPPVPPAAGSGGVLLTPPGPAVPPAGPAPGLSRPVPPPPPAPPPPRAPPPPPPGAPPPPGGGPP